jgi:hypothetical protein
VNNISSEGIKAINLNTEDITRINHILNKEYFKIEST